MKNPELIQCLQRFFRDYLANQRNVSSATLAAYGDTFRLLLRFLRQNHKKSSPLLLEVLTPDIILRFLDHLELKRGNCTRTRNARLAAIRSFVHYLSDWLGPALPPALSRILGIPSKRHAQRLVGFLNRQEVEAILAATGETWTGQRDHLLFQLLYNTGARISEILSLKASDIAVAERHLDLQGKGRKCRRVPLWPQTQKRLRCRRASAQHWLHAHIELLRPDTSESVAVVRLPGSAQHLVFVPRPYRRERAGDVHSGQHHQAQLDVQSGNSR